MKKGIYSLVAILAGLVLYIKPELVAAVAAFAFFPWINGDFRKTIP